MPKLKRPHSAAKSRSTPGRYHPLETRIVHHRRFYGGPRDLEVTITRVMHQDVVKMARNQIRRESNGKYVW